MGSESAKSGKATAQKGTKSEERSRRAPEIAHRKPAPGMPFLGLQRALGNRSASALLTPPPSRGRPLPYAARQLFDGDAREVADRVRIYTGGDAADYADAADANALAFGYDIVFDAEMFSFSTPMGRRLLAHEFAHVLQQSTDGLPPASEAEAERDADRYADDVVAGRPSRITYSTPLRAARQPKPKEQIEVPERGRFFVFRDTDGMPVYRYNIEDVKTWPNELEHVFTTYILDTFPGATVEIAHEYLRENPDVAVEHTPQNPHRKTAAYGPTVNFHHSVVRWMSNHYPDLKAVPVPTGNRKITDDKPATSSSSGEPEQVTVHGLPRAGRQPGGTSKLPAQQATTAGPGGGSIYSEAKTREGEGGYPVYEPLGKMTIKPELPVYVEGSKITARVRFDAGNEKRAELNIFPNAAKFVWTLYKGRELIDSNTIIQTGVIEYDFNFKDKGEYTISVIVSSREFINGKTLNLVSGPLKVVAEKDREAAVFESTLVGSDPNKPFDRDAQGRLIVKAGYHPQSIRSEIDGLNIKIAAIAELEREHKLPPDDAKKFTDFFKEQLEGLKKIEQHVGSRPYYLFGTFLNREDSTSFPVRMFMNQTGRGLTDDLHPYVDVELYDSTLNPGEPRRSTGHGESTRLPDDPAAYADAEMDALNDAVGDWLHYNEFPDGTLHLDVQLLEGTKELRQWALDTHTTRKKVRKYLTVGTTIAGIALLIASPFTGGASASVGVLLLEGVVAGATVGMVIAGIQERIHTKTFHLDARFVMDMTALVTAFVGVAGTISKLAEPIGTVGGEMAAAGEAAAAGGAASKLPKMAVFNLGAGALNFAMMTEETQKEIDQENSEFNAARARVHDNATLAEMDEQHRARLAAIMGKACVSGGIILVATGVAAQAAADSEPPPGLPAGQRPPPPTEEPLPAQPPKPAAPPARSVPAAEVHDATPPSAPPPAPPSAPVAADETITLYHGTRQPGGVSKGIDVARSPGAGQDFGQGFSVTQDLEVAEQAAGMRPEPGGTGMRTVLRWDIPKSKLGKIVDIRPGGKERALYEAWLKEPPSVAVGTGLGSTPGFRTNEEYLSSYGVEHRGAEFDIFLKANNLADADTIIGDIGTPTTSGGAALEHRVSTQITIRSQKVADELNAIMRGPTPPTSGSGPPPPPIIPAPPPPPAPTTPTAPTAATGAPIPIRRGLAANDNAVETPEQAVQQDVQEQPEEQPMLRAAGDRETYASAAGPPRGTRGRKPPTKPTMTTTRTTPAQGGGGGRFGGGAAMTPSRRPNLRSVPPEHLEEPPLLPRAVDNYRVADGFEFFQRNRASYPKHIQDMIDAVNTPRMSDNQAIDRALKDYYGQQANVALGFPATSRQVSRPAPVPGGRITEETSPFTGAEKGHAPSAANPGTQVEAGFSPTPSGERKNLNLVGHTRSGETVKLDDFNFADRSGEEIKMPNALHADPRFAANNEDKIADELRRHYDFTRDWGFNPYRWNLLSERDYVTVVRLANTFLPPDWYRYITITHIP